MPVFTENTWIATSAMAIATMDKLMIVSLSKVCCCKMLSKFLGAVTLLSTSMAASGGNSTTLESRAKMGADLLDLPDLLSFGVMYNGDTNLRDTVDR